MLKQTRKTTEKFESVVIKLKQHYSGKPECFRSDYNKMSNLACIFALGDTEKQYCFPLKILENIGFSVEGINLEIEYWGIRYRNIRVLKELNDKLGLLDVQTCYQLSKFNEITQKFKTLCAKLSTKYERHFSEIDMIIQKHYYDTVELHSIVIEVQEIILTLLKLPPKACLFSDEQEKYIYGLCKIIPHITMAVEEQEERLSEILDEVNYIEKAF